jgi:hypothetical protein
MDDVTFVYDSALLHLDPSKTGQESSGEEPEEHHETLLDTAREKLQEEYGGKLVIRTVRYLRTLAIIRFSCRKCQGKSKTASRKPRTPRVNNRSNGGKQGFSTGK